MTRRSPTQADRISYTVEEAAAAVGLSRRTLARAIEQGDLTVRYVTSRPLILADDLRAWIQTAPTERPA